MCPCVPDGCNVQPGLKNAELDWYLCLQKSAWKHLKGKIIKKNVSFQCKWGLSGHVWLCVSLVFIYFFLQLLHVSIVGVSSIMSNSITASDTHLPINKLIDIFRFSTLWKILNRNISILDPRPDLRALTQTSWRGIWMIRGTGFVPFCISNTVMHYTEWHFWLTTNFKYTGGPMRL